ncbi:MAG: TetR/AcrR family transcriptional regulator, partial [Mycobacterium sp.]
PMTTGDVTDKPLRADARRNYDAILTSAKEIFACEGTGAALEEVARAAGVGQGTLYRHFPTRDHLFVAILRERVDQLETRAGELLGSDDPWSALVEWLRLFDQTSSRYRGLSLYIGRRLQDDDSPVAAACAPMKARFVELFDRARRQRAVRDDVAPAQVLALIGALPKDAAGHTDPPLFDVAIAGLRRGQT